MKAYRSFPIWMQKGNGSLSFRDHDGESGDHVTAGYSKPVFDLAVAYHTPARMGRKPNDPIGPQPLCLEMTGQPQAMARH